MTRSLYLERKECRDYNTLIEPSRSTFTEKMLYVIKHLYWPCVGYFNKFQLEGEQADRGSQLEQGWPIPLLVQIVVGHNQPGGQTLVCQAV